MSIDFGQEPSGKRRKKKKSGMPPVQKVGLYCALAVPILLLAFLGWGGGLEKGARSKSHPKTVSAARLIACYDANSVGADLDYGGRLLKVNGVVGRVGRDILGNAYVTLTGGGNQFLNVQCFFDSSNSSSLAFINPGDKCSVIGTCAGMALNVHLNHCELSD